MILGGVKIVLLNIGDHCPPEKIMQMDPVIFIWSDLSDRLAADDNWQAFAHCSRIKNHLLHFLDVLSHIVIIKSIF